MFRLLSKLIWRLTKPRPSKEIRDLQKQREVAVRLHKARRQIDARIREITNENLRKAAKRKGDKHG